MGYVEHGNAIILKFSIPYILTPFNYTNQMHSIYIRMFLLYVSALMCHLQEEQYASFLKQIPCEVGSFFRLSFVVNIDMM